MQRLLKQTTHAEPSSSNTFLSSLFAPEKNQVSIQAQDRDFQLACVQLKRLEPELTQLALSSSLTFERTAKLTIPVFNIVPFLLQVEKGHQHGSRLCQLPGYP